MTCLVFHLLALEMEQGFIVMMMTMIIVPNSLTNLKQNLNHTNYKPLFQLRLFR